ncbi:hypothetical protein Tco_0312792 [Tanacetum coccineum]
MFILTPSWKYGGDKSTYFKANRTISIAFIINNFEITLRLEEFARILSLFNQIPLGKTRKVKGVETTLDPFQMVLSELKTNLMKWEIILSENAMSLTRNKDHPNACLCYMLYFLTIGKPFNLAYYIANRMVSVTKSTDTTLPYGMLLTRLFEHVCIAHPYTFSNDLDLVDQVMIPLSEKRVFRIMPDGKRPRLPTLTPSTSKSSDSPSPSPHQGGKTTP